MFEVVQVEGMPGVAKSIRRILESLVNTGLILAPLGIGYLNVDFRSRCICAFPRFDFHLHACHPPRLTDGGMCGICPLYH